MRIFVTGAAGFVGEAVCRRLLAEGHAVVGALRRPRPVLDGVEAYPLGDLAEAEPAPLTAALRGVDAVVHLAGRAHVMQETEADPAAAFHRANVTASRKLAAAAREAGVTRFVYMSSVKALAERSAPGKPLSEADAPQPEDDYGRSKRAAEEALSEALAGSETSLSILRPPLVHGPGVRGNLESLLKLMDRGLPLPFGAITGNRRSLVGVETLADAVRHLLTRQPAPEGVFLVSDDDDLSTADLVRALAAGREKPVRLVSVPPALLTFAAKVAGRGELAERLTGSLQLDISRLKQTGWTPPVSAAEGLAETARRHEQQLASASRRG